MSDKAQIIVSSMLAMARDLDLSSVAEGIETQGELEACRALGVLFGQGWHLGRPVPLDELIESLRARQAPSPVPTGERA